MSIKKSDGKWLVHIDRKGLKRVRKSFETKKEAEAFERDYLSHAPAVLVTSDKRKLSELIQIWYKFHGVNLTNGTKHHAVLVAMCAGLKNPVACDLKPAQFLEYRYKCIHGNSKTIAAKTMNNRQTYLLGLYNTLRKLKVIDYICPIADVDFLKIQERQLSYLSESQIFQLFDRLKNDCRNECVWWIAQICLRTGARWGEAEKLKRKQLHNCRVTYEFTKSKKVRTVPLDANFYASLLTFAEFKNPEDRLFKDSITAFNRTVARSKLTFPKGQSTHILRHSFASYFVMRGGDILTLQKILGHSDIKMTLRYAHLAPDHLLDAVRLNPLNIE